MKNWKKFLALLTLVCLLANAVPMATAAGTDEEARRGLDYSELELQVALANGLNSYDYTIESWEPLQKALDVGNKRLAGIYDQGKLDSAAKDISRAIARLVKMDYSALIKAMDAVDLKVEANPEYHDVWYRLNKAVEDAKPLLISGDQEAVHAATKEINMLLEELAACNIMTAEPEIIIQEVEVEVLPTNDFCNIPSHHTWPLLFAISAVVNVALIVVLVFMVMKTRKTEDDTPLVNYDIDDDMDF